MMKIDVEEINAILFRLGDPPKYYKKYGMRFRSGVFMGILMFFRYFICSFYQFPLKYSKVENNYKGVIFLYETINQKNALAPIVDKYKSTSSLVLSLESLPLWRTYIYALPFLFQLCCLYFSVSVDKKKVIRAYFSRFWQSYGVYVFFQKVIQRYKPRVIVMANDHNVWQRCLIQIANEEHIETIYVQHASVSDIFPPLQFSHAFLDGLESWEKYRKTGINKGNVYLSGGVRFDAVSELDIEKNSSEYSVIGVAANALDNIDKIKKLCLTLQKEIDKVEIIFRPHPEILNNVDLIKWCLSKGISISYPNKERVYEFLFRINVLISNESAIHLDALICHTNTILFNTSDIATRDYYGYICKGLVREIRSTEEIIECIQNNTIYKAPDKVLQYYHAAYQTKNEGRIAILVSKTIDSILSDTVSLLYLEYGWELLKSTDSYRVYCFSA